jgi:CheY-like chemotaxis protein
METKKILVVDDEKGICENVQKILAKNNYEVTQALSAKEALEMMANESYSLLISDIVMPGKNGLELLKLVKEQWPLTKVIIMTAYASTDTAMKAIRLGALDYIPKPFTPKEIRVTVEKAFSGELHETPVSEKERKVINVIDLDIPFDRQEVAKYAGEEYADKLGPSDMPIVEMPSPETLEYYCKVGQKVCDIFKKLANTCKAGLKSSECPQAKKGAKAKKAAEGKAFDPRKLIGIDQPFSYEEVASVTGPEYLMNLQSDGIAFVPYEELKASMKATIEKPKKLIDVDIPFEREEVAKQTGQAYADALGPSDMPSVSAPSPETLEHYCMVGRKVCDIYRKLGNTCKAGLKTSECPQMKGKKKAGPAKGATPDIRKLIGPHMPFSYEEVVAVTGPEFVKYLEHDGLGPHALRGIKGTDRKAQGNGKPPQGRSP